MKRRSLTPSEKARVVERQLGLCAECGEALAGKIEFDHRLALALGGDNSIDNFEALHVRPCHLARTRVTVGMKSKADRQRKAFETGHGRTHKRTAWSWLSFSGQRRTSRGKNG